VGKILGQGGENVKRLQEMANCRIAVLGRGSMKDKNKVRIMNTLKFCETLKYFEQTFSHYIAQYCWTHSF